MAETFQKSSNFGSNSTHSSWIRSLATEVISRPTGEGPVYIRGDSSCCEKNYTTEIIYKLNTAR